MLLGTIIENSLNDTCVLERLTILKSWTAGSWVLHRVQVSKAEAMSLSEYLAEGPWYVHFWEEAKDDVLVVFKKKTFSIKHSNKSTWVEAVEYGKSIGIPEGQLNFVV